MTLTKKTKGYSLVELSVVLAVIAILSGIAAVKYPNWKRARDEKKALALANSVGHDHYMVAFNKIVELEKKYNTFVHMQLVNGWRDVVVVSVNVADQYSFVSGYPGQVPLPIISFNGKDAIYSSMAEAPGWEGGRILSMTVSADFSPDRATYVAEGYTPPPTPTKEKTRL